MLTQSFALLTGLPPVLNSQTRILILGSFPGAASLAAAQYYAHPRNQFWRLLSALFNEDFVTLHYAERLNRIAERHVGLWDVIAACERKGSLDTAIRQAKQTDFSILKNSYPAIHTIGFNGKTAGKAAPVFEAAGYRTCILPSSSPAHAQLSFAQKLVQWRQLLG
jgi:TDG/mug DNA glycosylase family protein